MIGSLKYANRAEVINGVDAQTNSHDTGTVQLDG